MEIKRPKTWVYVAIGATDCLIGCPWYIVAITTYSMSVLILRLSQSVWYWPDLDWLAWTIVYALGGWAGMFLIINLTK